MARRLTAVTSNLRTLCVAVRLFNAAPAREVQAHIPSAARIRSKLLIPLFQPGTKRRHFLRKGRVVMDDNRFLHLIADKDVRRCSFLEFRDKPIPKYQKEERCPTSTTGWLASARPDGTGSDRQKRRLHRRSYPAPEEMMSLRGRPRNAGCGRPDTSALTRCQKARARAPKTAATRPAAGSTCLR